MFKIEVIKMTYGYVRVSSKSQEDNNSLAEQKKEILEKYPLAEIESEVFTAAKDFDDRGVFNSLIGKLVEGDTLVVCKMDRFCRNAREGLSIIEDVLNRKVTIHILNVGIIDNSPIGKLIFTVLLSFAEFERNMILERTIAGRIAARQNPNYREGRPKKFSKEQIELALELLKSNSYCQVSKMTGISKSTLQRAKQRNLLEKTKAI